MPASHAGQDGPGTGSGASASRSSYMAVAWAVDAVPVVGGRARAAVQYGTGKPAAAYVLG